VNTGNVTGTVTYTITPTFGTCSGAAVNYVVTVNPVPTATASNLSICSGQTTSVIISPAPSNVAGTTFSWNVATSNVTGATGGSGSVISQMLTSTDGVTSGTATYTVTPSANGCNGTPIVVVVTVNPVPVITNTPGQLLTTICSASALNFTPTSTIGGTTYSWTSSISGPISGASVTASGSGAITDAPVNTGNVAGAVTYTITPTLGSCNGVPVNYVVTVSPVPTATAANQSICSGQSSSVSITAAPTNVAGTSYSWTVATSNVTGASAGSGSIISQVLASTDGINTGTATYTITPSASGCPGTPIVVVVTVNPVPVITSTATQLINSICSGGALNFTPTSTIVGTTYTWTSTISGPISPASVTAAGSGAILDAPLNTGNISGTVVYRITPAFGGCSGTPVDYVVTVLPLPSASATDITICSGSAAVVPISSAPQNVAGTTFSWIVIPTANVVGASADNGSLISQTLTLTNSVVGSVIYRITPVAAGCVGPTFDVTVTVNPVATVDAGVDYAVCEPVTVPVSGTIGGAATGGTWTIVSGAGTISASTTTGTNVTAIYTVAAGDIAGNVILLLTTNDPDAAGPCSAVSDQLTIAVNRRATVNAGADFTVCEPVSINLSGVIGASATSGLWSVVAGAGVLSASSVSGTTVSASYVVDPSDVGTVVTFRLTTNDPDGFGPCVPEFDEISVTINQAAQVSAGADLALCENIPGIALLGTIGGSTATVVWSGGLGSFSNANDPTATYSFANPAEVNTNITLTLTALDPDGAGPCTSVFDQMVLRINPLPAVVFSGLPAGAPPQLAENAPILQLIGNQAGGLFTILPGTGLGSTFINVVDRVNFDPDAATLGINDITYTFTDGNGCMNANTQQVLVNPVTIVDFSVQGAPLNGAGEYELCAQLGLVKLNGFPDPSTGQAPETQFTVEAITPGLTIVTIGPDYFIQTTGVLSGTYLVRYTYKNALGAISFRVRPVKIFASPAAAIQVTNSCIVSAVEFDDVSTIPNNTYGGIINNWVWNFGDGFQSPLQNPDHIYSVSGVYNVSLKVTTDQGCSNTTAQNIRVGDVPVVDFNWSSICNGDDTKFEDLTNPGSISVITNLFWEFGDGFTVSGAPGGSVPGGTNGGRTTGTFDMPNQNYDNFGTYSAKLTVQTNDGCSNSLSKTVFILPYNTVIPTAGSAYAENFDAGKGGWVEEPIGTVTQDTSWLFGTPYGLVINSASSAPNAWWTGKNDSSYYDLEQSVVNGPCFDLRQLSRPMLSMDIFSHTQERSDGAVVQYSVNGGLTWFTVGEVGPGINWYNSSTIGGTPGNSVFGFGWTGAVNNSLNWQNARFSLDTIPALQRQFVRLRVAFGSDAASLPDTTFNGFAFDNILVGERQRNVFVEHFTNSTVAVSNQASAYLDNLYNNEIALYNVSDFNKVQYHMSFPSGDPLNLDNPAAPAARGLLYGVSQPPTTIMDGILDGNKFNGFTANITAEEIDRRALTDPQFDIVIDTFATSSNNIQVRLTITALQATSAPLLVNIALVENPVGAQRNVLRKLLYGEEGISIIQTWTPGLPRVIPVQTIPIDVPIVNGANLSLIAFVQDKNTHEIYQSEFLPMAPKQGATIVGLPEANRIQADQVMIFPNPATHRFFFGVPDDLRGREFRFKMFDNRGVEVRSGQIDYDHEGVKEVDIMQLSSGVYHLGITGEDGAVSYRKIVIVNRN
jgi:hypothetical protein